MENYWGREEEGIIGGRGRLMGEDCCALLSSARAAVEMKKKKKFRHEEDG